MILHRAKARGGARAEIPFKETGPGKKIPSKPDYRLLAEDHAIARRGLCLGLAQYRWEFKIVGEGRLPAVEGGGKDWGTRMLRHGRHDLMDIAMPALNGLEGPTGQNPPPPIRRKRWFLILSAQQRDEEYNRARHPDGRRRGFLEKQTSDRNFW